MAYESIIVTDPEEEGYNSFVSLEQANAYFAGTYFPAGTKGWLDLDPQEQDQVLITASRALSALNWTGAPVTTTQVLAFPRSYLYWEYGDAVDNVMPSFLTALVCEYAKWIWQEGDRTLSDNDMSAIKSLSIGEISVTLKDGSSAFLPPSVMALLGPLAPTYLLLGGKVRSATMWF